MIMKYYAVKTGKIPGIYYNWDECKDQINKYPGAIFKSFENIEQANKFLTGKEYNTDRYTVDSLNCDGAYSARTNIMEYNIADTTTGKILVNKKFDGGTNNIAEFLGLVEAMRLLKTNNIDKIIYTDSLTALAWVRNKNINSVYDITDNKKIEQDVWGARVFLSKINISDFNLKKWDTVNWGQIPSDFGRK